MTEPLSSLAIQWEVGLEQSHEGQMERENLPTGWGSAGRCP